MTKKKTDVTIPDEAVISKIYLIRKHKVMLDIDFGRTLSGRNQKT